jgi:hypothetical protein
VAKAERKRGRKSVRKKPKNCRQRKSKEQLAVLHEFHLRNKEWGKAEILELHSLTGLSEKQVSKWQWD